MKFLIIASEKDEAGKNIFNVLRNFPQLNSFIITDKDTIYAENIDKQDNFKEFDFIIFATKHQSKEHRKTFSIHAPGNWKQAELGGLPEKVCPTSALFNKLLFQNLKKQAEFQNLDYEITLEVTHHGPFIEKPCVFIEIGSSLEQWKDKKAGEVITKTIEKAINEFESLDKTKLEKLWKPAIGLGGLHYAPNFNKIQLSQKLKISDDSQNSKRILKNSDYALSHIIPEYCLPITEQMIKQAIEKTIEKNPIFILDWKGLGKSEDRQKLIQLLDKLNLKYIRTSNVEK